MAYFDNAATSFPKPTTVATSANLAITVFGGNPGRGGHDYSMRASEEIFKIRTKIAQFFNAQAENVIFTSNCTMSLNMAIKGIIKDGDHIVTSCLEHNAVARPIFHLASENKITYSTAKVYEQKDKTIASFAALIKDNTKAIVCTHASNVSGIILPIEEIGALCKKKNILLIVDAAQSAGVIPIDMKKMNIDILCMAGHKGLYGMTGTGILIIKEGITLNSIIEGGTGSRSSDLEQPDFYPDKLESGTLNTAGIFTVGAGIDFIKKVGEQNIYEREFAFCSQLYNKLVTIKNVKLYQENFRKGIYVPIVAFNIIGMPSEKVVELLNFYGFALRGGLHCAPLAHQFYGTLDSGIVRFSPSFFTKNTSVEKLSKIIHIIAKKNYDLT